MTKRFTISVKTDSMTQFIIITEEIEKVVEESGIKDGMAYIITNHTTSGITVNEGLECLQADFENFFEKLVPNDNTLNHARFLHSYAAMANNGPSHIKALLTGNHTIFPVENGKLVRRFAQDIYFCEYDGPQDRGVTIVVMGD